MIVFEILYLARRFNASCFILYIACMHFLLHITIASLSLSLRSVVSSMLLENHYTNNSLKHFCVGIFTLFCNIINRDLGMRVGKTGSNIMI